MNKQEFRKLIREEIRTALTEQPNVWDKDKIITFTKQIKKPSGFMMSTVTASSKNGLSGRMSFAWTPTLILHTKFKVDPGDPSKLVIVVDGTRSTVEKKDGGEYNGADFAKDLSTFGISNYSFNAVGSSCVVTIG